jgi:hypothetical protein
MEKKRNLWVIPTDKPTYLYEMEGKFHLSDKFEKGNEFWHNQNIYITSDEEIKVGYHVFNTKNNHYGGVVNKNNLSDARLLSYIKKIILTTDVDLIKDGVQEIDDEFLKWFVKNPSCEFVKTDSYKTIYNTLLYKIIIPSKETLKKLKSFYEKYPKEEPKQKYALVDTYPDLDKLLKDKKQETLEEAAENFMSKNTEEFDFRRNSKFWNFGMKLIKFGAQWQAKQLFKDDAIQTLEKGLALLLKKQERMYSEEEVYELLKTYRNSIVEVNPIDIIYLDKWFEQFKKK